MIGSTFGQFTITGEDPYVPGLLVCLCSCGAKRLRKLSDLKSEADPHCGATAHYLINKSHRRERNAYNNAVQRCTNPKHKRFHRYGGRGIVVCENWRASFRLFLKDMGPCPPGYSLERKNNDGNYEPGNCVWIPSKNQWRNRSRNKWVVWRGKRMLFSDAVAASGLPAHSVRSRIYTLGWPVAKALETPIDKRFSY